MAAKVISGTEISQKIMAELGQKVANLKSSGITPSLAVILVGDDPASRIYVANKEKACGQIGINSVQINLPNTVNLQQLISEVKRLNEDRSIHGILVQLPLPSHLDEDKVIEAIDPAKDVDCFHPMNVGLLIAGRPFFLPCTPHGIYQILLHAGIKLEGKHVVILGRSNIVGRPLSILLSLKEMGNATVTLCHSRSGDIAHYTKQADIVVAAMGKPELLRGDMIKEGAIVIDVGINRIPDANAKKGYRLVGDCHFDSVAEKASAITPVPGGVGPMTVVMLLHNTIKAAERLASARP